MSIIPAPTAAATSTPSRLYHGVRLEPDGRWEARVSEGDGSEGCLIGHFRKEAHAALAHDRVAVFLGGAGARVNFPPSFSAMERLYLSRRCTAEFVFRAVLDETYDMEYEGFLYAEFDKYLCGHASEETARAVAEFAAREGLGLQEIGYDVKTATRTFVMGHMNPVLCTSWIDRFHEGNPNRGFFTCKEAHQLNGMRLAVLTQTPRQ